MGSNYDNGPIVFAMRPLVQRIDASFSMNNLQSAGNMNDSAVEPPPGGVRIMKTKKHKFLVEKSKKKQQKQRHTIRVAVKGVPDKASRLNSRNSLLLGEFDYDDADDRADEPFVSSANRIVHNSAASSPLRSSALESAVASVLNDSVAAYSDLWARTRVQCPLCGLICDQIALPFHIDSCGDVSDECSVADDARATSSMALSPPANNSSSIPLESESLTLRDNVDSAANAVPHAASMRFLIRASSAGFASVSASCAAAADNGSNLTVQAEAEEDIVTEEDDDDYVS